MSVNVERMRRYRDRTVPSRIVITDRELLADYDAAMERAQEWEERTRRAYPDCEIVAWDDYPTGTRIARRIRRP